MDMQIDTDIDMYIYIYTCVRRVNPNPESAAAWPLHDIAITNIVWHALHSRMVGGEHCIAQ